MSDFSTLISQIAIKIGIPADLFSNLVNVESGGNPYALGAAGEVGLTQLTPQVASQLGINPFDPQANLIGGATYLKQLYQHYGSWPAALSAYNSGAPDSNVGLAYARTVLTGVDPTTLQGGVKASQPNVAATIPASPQNQPFPVADSTTTAATFTSDPWQWAVDHAKIAGAYGVGVVLILALLMFGIWRLLQQGE
jgi:hypothetical protein